MRDKIKFLSETMNNGEQKISVIIKRANSGERVIYDLIMNQYRYLDGRIKKHMTFPDFRILQADARVIKRYFIQDNPSDINTNPKYNLDDEDEEES